MKRLKVILAPSYWEAAKFCGEHNLSSEDVVIVRGVRSLEGLRFRYEDVIRIPGWSKRSDIEAIEDRILSNHVAMAPRFTANNEIELVELVNQMVDLDIIDGVCTFGTTNH